MSSCNCGLSSNCPIGKVELHNQSGLLNHKSLFSSLVGDIPLIPQLTGFSRLLTKFQCTLGVSFWICATRLATNGYHLLSSDFNHSSVIWESNHAKVSDIGTVSIGRVACNKLARSKAEPSSSRGRD
ncbi:hypothetical protein NPIL_372991 [Nephila pilipes]|uniref:Uncharacterized protein n=1 Tax=Nephila pilipes TaxID=299642 RepID=A0A8X6MTF9_NEPPI|nr:hypothetical protein NPIL_372991 [Nephila pilipes]